MSSPSWPWFPVFLRLGRRKVVVVGGGEVAARKLRLLARTGARLQVVATKVCAEIADSADKGRLEWLAAPFAPMQLDGAALAIAATDDAEVNAAVAAAAHARGIPVNVVDDASHSSFITPAIVDRAPVLVAIGTSATGPVLARRLREAIERLLPARLGRLARFMGSRRAHLAAVPVDRRRRVWERFLDGPGAEAAMQGDEAAADAALSEAQRETPRGGEVWLVGAGPGDPELLTLRALRLMQQADVVLHDRLVPPEILELVRRDAERIDVGKRRDHHPVPQQEINRMLVELARAGKRVLRLKGGDPFVFGRGGEEIDSLREAGIPFQVVPGITAANGCAAYAGIPLTHRDHAQACVFVTGHPRRDGTLDLPWDALARRGQTVVVYMGRGTLALLCERLIAAGLPPDWPAALVEHGTMNDQRVVTGTLSDLPQRVAERGIDGPSLIIVGQVVRLREQLRWFAGAGQEADSA